MADFSSRKRNPHGTYPAQHEVKPERTDVLGSGFTRVEPWLTPDRLKQQYLFGINLVSPWTKQEITNDTLKDIIARAAARVELECNVDVFPVVRVVRVPWDRVKMTQGFGQIELGVRNIRNILEVSIRTTDSMQVQNGVSQNDTDAAREGHVLFTVPLQWIDMSYARKGIIHINSLLSNTIAATTTGSPLFGGFMHPIFNASRHFNNMPSYFFIRYESGFEENSIPSIVNDLIGTLAAIDVLSLLGPTNRFNSQSIGLDGASQGVSGPGNQLYVVRINELMQKAEMLKDVIKSRFTNRVFMRHI